MDGSDDLEHAPSARRILDASLNRCAEALRVVEDVARFHWILPLWSRELKELRHAALELFAPTVEARSRLAAARDIEGDVGASIPSPAPAGGAPARGAADVAVRNLERAKEALRTLEEISRIASPEVAAAVESLRYRLYSIENGVLRMLSPARPRLELGGLYVLVTRSLCRGEPEDIVRGALAGGAAVIQMREKDLPARELLAWGRRLRAMTAEAGALFVVNDRPDLAALLHADGVHLGQDDLPLSEARAIPGDGMLIGISTHDTGQARKAVREGADYIGIGPVFASTTKDAGTALGVDGFSEVLRAIEPVPAFAIGGVTIESVRALQEGGARGVAVCSAILDAGSAGEAERLASEFVRGLSP